MRAAVLTRFGGPTRWSCATCRTTTGTGPGPRPGGGRHEQHRPVDPGGRLRAPGDPGALAGWQGRWTSRASRAPTCAATSRRSATASTTPWSVDACWSTRPRSRHRHGGRRSLQPVLGSEYDGGFAAWSSRRPRPRRCRAPLSDAELGLRSPTARPGMLERGRGRGRCWSPASGAWARPAGRGGRRVVAQTSGKEHSARRGPTSSRPDGELDLVPDGRAVIDGGGRRWAAALVREAWWPVRSLDPGSTSALRQRTHRSTCASLAAAAEARAGPRAARRRDVRPGADPRGRRRAGVARPRRQDRGPARDLRHGESRGEGFERRSTGKPLSSIRPDLEVPWRSTCLLGKEPSRRRVTTGGSSLRPLWPSTCASGRCTPPASTRTRSSSTSTPA